MTRITSDSTRYIIQVGNNRFRRSTWESLKDISSIEGTPMADEIWCALDAHVRAYASRDAGDGRGLMDKGPQPDFSLPENSNVFDKLVDDVVLEAAAEEVEEVLENEETEETEKVEEVEEHREHGRVASSDMFGHYRKK